MSLKMGFYDRMFSIFCVPVARLVGRTLQSACIVQLLDLV